MTEGPVYFLADAHLGIESEPLEAAKERDLLDLLTHLRGRASFLYLLGDLFDFWFEYPGVTPGGHRSVVEALSELSRSGTTVRFLGGNHDYWAGRKFEAMTGATVHRDPITQTHFGRRLFMAHGDGLPSGDLGYRMLKAVIRNPVSIASFTLVPPRVGAAIARWASNLSEITDERIVVALAPMKDFLESKLAEGFDAAVVGHVHRQVHWQSESGDAIVVGDWMWNRSVVELSDGGFRMLRWSESALVESEPSEAVSRPPEVSFTDAS
jgi:UDP-2,3-diacylglucosamine hydrolase